MHFRPVLPGRPLWTALALTAALVLSVLWVAAAAQARPAASTPAQPPAQPASKIAARVLAATANGGRTSVVIFLNDQADVSAGYGMKDEDARGWYVYTTLFNKAAQTQVSLRSMLSAAGVSFQSFWVANMIVADNADRTLVDMLAARADVRAVDSNAAARWIEAPTIANFQPASASPNTVEWGVQTVNAPQVWALGYTGQGIVIANQDTGMRWTQAAIKPHYRGWNGTTADHNYNWHDSIHSGGGICGANSPVPCDDSGHGTHTTGTTSGDDGSGNQIGVAPGAKWIGCRNMDQGNGTPASYSECFQFFIAPTDLNGQNPNPALRPHVMNNSWGCPTSEGCTTRGELETIVNNTQASGIFVEASAGNSGSACSSVTDPPAIYDAAFSTGATDSSNNLASFSSRGPSTYYTPNLLKPNISAPGVNVRSSYYSSDTSYAILSGTSMAGPHVVGVVALLWSARPQLSRDITDTKQILENTANPGVVAPAQTCGGIPSSQIPNNSFGYGLVDALAAVNSVAQGTPTPTATGVAATATRTSTPTGATATPTACAPTSWATASAVPTAVEGGFLTTDGTYAYLAGGYDGSAVIARFARYNPPADTWTVLAAMPTPADGTGIVYSPANNKVYVFGGANDPGNALDVTRIYDVAAGTWTTGATMPAARQRFAAVGYWNGQIYLVGGRTDLNGTSAQSQVWRYDPLANSWNTSLASLPVGMGGSGWGVLNGHIYVLSGIDSSGAISTAAYDYDISANTWTSRAAVPTGVNTPGSAVVGGRIWIFGGDDGTLGAHRAADHAPHVDTNLTQVYDPASNSWSAGPALNVNRSDVGGTTVGSYVIAADGYAGGVLDTTEVALGGCGSATPTPGGATATPTACVPSTGSWTDLAHIPVLKGRALGVNYQSSIYVFGGRGDNTTYTQDVYRYDLGANSWSLLPQQFPDQNSSNMGGGLLTFPEGPRIFVVGGSGANSVVTGRTFAFNPADGSFTAKAAWPASPVHLPGGWAVMNNKLYVFGGYNPNVEMEADIWVYDPTTDTWTQSAANLSMARGYIATEAMPDGLIYLAGGSQYNGGNLTDETIFEKFNPATNTISSGPDMPVALSNNHGYNLQGQFYVVAGGFTTSVTTVEIYDPASNSWRAGPDALDPVRNYAKGYGLDGSIYAIGGTQDFGGTDYHDYNQKFTPSTSCGTATVTPAVPTATATAPPATATSGVATATATHVAASVTPGAASPTRTPVGGSPTATPTECAISFSDVHPTDYFYEPVRYLYCHGVISGYGDNTFRPYNNTTRAQMVKIVVLGFGIAVTTPAGGAYTFHDVPPTAPFFDVIETAAAHNIISGYNCGAGGPGPCDPQNRPYFLPNNPVTRGQLSKIDVIAAGWPQLNPSTPTFTDVPAANPFYAVIETAVCHGVVSGYADHTFHPFAEATRGQISKIVYLSILNAPGSCAATPAAGNQ